MYFCAFVTIGARHLCPEYWLGDNRYLCDLFYSHHFFSRRGDHGVHFGGGACGDVCPNGRGLKPVFGHRTAGTVNRAQFASKFVLFHLT